jgi:hypothetical protein
MYGSWKLQVEVANGWRHPANIKGGFAALLSADILIIRKPDQNALVAITTRVSNFIHQHVT